MSWSHGPSDPSGDYQQRPPRNRFFESMRGSGWYRAQPRVIGGVCSGVAARTGWDMSLVRVLTVLAAFFIPVVPLAYALGWLLLPEAQDGRIHLEEALEGRFDIAVVGGIVLGLFSLSSLIPSVGLIFGGAGIGFGSFFALAIIGGLIGLVYLVVASASSSNKRRGPGAPGQYGTPRYGTPQYGGQQGTSPAGDTAPFGGTTPSASGAGPASPGQASPEHPAGYPFYGVPADSPSASGAPGAQAGPRPAAARPSQPHPGWRPPAGPPKPRQWTPRPAPTHRPRTVSARANLAITGLLVLVAAAVFAGIYMVDKGPAIPFITAASQSQTIARIIVIGGGVCLIIVGLSLAIAALRDRSAGWLTTLSILGLILALPTAAIGTEATHNAITTIGSTIQNPTSDQTVDWTVSSVHGSSPLSTVTLDLSGAPAGTTKSITVSWQAWQNLTIKVAEGQPVQIVCQSSIDSLATNMDNDGWAAPLRDCSDKTATSPSWGKSSLGGITVLITQDAELENLTILQTPDSSGTWGSTPAPAPSATPSPTPSATPSTTPSPAPSPTPTGSQSGN
ncbi:PspC domain-containing protein [Schaalia odontolytica]|uniref:PspC domain-containing protein n=1 Tax=Schaalia odontolytica TaxID=1660 RepID=UPI001D083545|nr:PspC domain-containing protein [Schaalia odontolytica]MCB6402642.1 PspC domain-containing protein [Schaalia odontolytica]